MTAKSPDPAKAEPKEKVVVDDTAKAQPPAPEVSTYTDKDGIERINVISDDKSWTPAPTTVTYPKGN